AAGVRMRVDIARFAVRGPASVTNAERPMHRLLLAQFRELADASGLLADIDRVIVLHGHAGGVVSPVFQPVQTFQKEIERGFGSNISDNSAHRFTPRWCFSLESRLQPVFTSPIKTA